MAATLRSWKTAGNDLDAAVREILKEQKPTLAQVRADGWATADELFNRMPESARSTREAFRIFMLRCKAFDSMLARNGRSIQRVYRLRRKR